MGKVLHVVDTLERGGAESMIMNMYRHIDREKIQFDFVMHTDAEIGYYDEICAMGGRIFSAPRFNGRNFLKYIQWWDDFFESHTEYNVIHGHMRSCASLYLSRAHRKNRTTIAHSHSTSNGSGIGAIIKAVLQLSIRNQADYFMACSIQSAEWLFGKKVAHANKCFILPNGVDLQRFHFSQQERDKYRHKFCIAENEIAVCHVGNYTEAKNHRFIFEMFRELSKKIPAKLILVGTGSNEQIKQIQSMVVENELNEKVILTGTRNDVEKILTAVDVFVFPSKWEGFGIAALEAQAVGLQTYVSDTIPSEIRITSLVHALPIDNGVTAWVEDIMKSDLTHQDVQEKIRTAGYDIEGNARWLSAFYEKLFKDYKAK